MHCVIQREAWVYAWGFSAPESLVVLLTDFGAKWIGRFEAMPWPHA